MEGSKKERKMIGKKKLEELEDMLNELSEDVDRIYNDIYLDPLEKMKEPKHDICGIPEEVFEYMEEHCDTMFMGMS